MIPQIDIEIQNAEVKQYAGRTYSIDIDENRIKGMFDELEAIRQAVYLILQTEKGVYDIYSDEYGVKTHDLPGKSMDYVISVLPTRIEDALLNDGRILSVSDFAFEEKKGALTCSFTVQTETGDITAEEEVSGVV